MKDDHGEKVAIAAKILKDTFSLAPPDQADGSIVAAVAAFRVGL
jgi:hypothetical protein